VKSIWSLVRLDLAVLRRTPWIFAAALIPPIAMYFLVAVLTEAVTEQPVALVTLGQGPQSKAMASIIEQDTDAYMLTVTTAPRAEEMLERQEVAAVIVIPADFDERVSTGNATVNLTLNNTDIDFSDDIRRSVDRSVSRFDAPQLGASVAATADDEGVTIPNPYRVDIDERSLRETDVSFESYQTQPVLLLVIINVAMVGGALLGTRDRERRTAALLHVMPVSPVQRVLGRMLAIVVATSVVLAGFVAWITWRGWIHMPQGHWPAFVGVLLATTVMASGLGVLLGAAFRRSTSVALASVLAATYLFFLGGGFTTIVFLPEWLQDVSRAIPTRYAIDAMRQALFYPDLRGYGEAMLALVVFAVVAAAGGAVALRRSVT